MRRLPKSPVFLCTFLIINYQLLIINYCVAQKIEGFRHYDISNGLPSNEVYDIMEDQYGYLWFSTDNGVSRFNGETFKNFTTDDGLVDNTVFRCIEDKTGRIWFLSFSSQLCYFENDKIQAYEFNSSIERLGLNKDVKLSITIDDKDVYVGTATNGYYRVDCAGHASLINICCGTSVIETPGGALIFNSKFSNELSEVDSDQTKEFNSHFTLYGVSYPLKKTTTSFPRLAQEKSGTYFTNGFQLYSIADDKPHLLLSSNYRISDIYESHDGLLWLAMVNAGAKAFVVTDTSLELKESIIENKYVSSICEDFEGGVWIATAGFGVYHRTRYNFTEPRISNLPELLVEDIIVKANRRFISFTNGTIWEIIDDSKAMLVDSLPNSKFIAEVNPLEYSEISKKVISKSYVKNLLESELKLKTEDLEITSMAFDGLQRLWVGSNKYLFRLVNDAIDTVITLQNLNIWNSNHQSVTINRIDALQAFDGDKMLVSTLEGLFVMHNNKVEFLGNENPLFNSRIDEIQSNSQNMVLMASRGNGVVLWKDEQVVLINEHSGLSSNLVKSVCAQNDSVIWAGTQKGLSRISFGSKGDFTSQIIGEIQGLPSDYISKIKVCQNKLYVGTNVGLSVIDLDNLEFNRIAPKIRINGLKILDNSRPIKENNIFSYSENMILISYDAISFRNNKARNFMYQLEGQYDAWYYTKSKEVRFNNLPPGKYTFRVKVVNEDGFWSDPSTFKFAILPPYWETWQFRLLLAFTLTLTLTLIIRARIRQLNDRTETVEAKLTSLRAQMNPHFTFNTLNAIQEYIISNKTMAAADYLSRFAGLIRRVLENSRHSLLSFDDEVTTLRMYLELEKMRSHDKLDFEMSVAPDVPYGMLEVPPSIIQPYVENAVVHGILPKEGNGKITIRFEMEGELLKCTVEDDGVGRGISDTRYQKSDIRSELRKKKSLGMEITGERLRLMRRGKKRGPEVRVTDLFDEHGKPAGTKVELWIPVAMNN